MSKYLVGPEDGSWVVKREGARDIQFRSRNQDQAIEKARQLAKKDKTGQVLILDEPLLSNEEEAEQN